jgi:hypothetical protein
LRGLQHFAEGDAHALGDGSDVAHNRHELSIRWMPGGLHDAVQGYGNRLGTMFDSNRCPRASRTQWNAAASSTATGYHSHATAG